MTITLEPDQIELLNAGRGKMLSGFRSILLQAATGFGKSFVASALALGILGKGNTVMMLVPRRELVRQMDQTFNDFGIEHSFIAAGQPFNPYARCWIASTGTLITRLNTAPVPSVLIIDETHFGGDGLDRIIKHYKALGVWIIGLSATPWKNSGKGLGCWYDTMVLGPSVKWLIDNKRLSQYEYYCPDVPDLSGIKIIGGDYSKSQIQERMDSNRALIGNAVNHYKQHAMGRLGITFAVSIKSSEEFAQRYRDAGIPAAHMDGNTPEHERRQIARAFAKREILQLCNSELLSFGYDLSAASGIKGVCIETMTDCAPTKSLAKQMQKWGRNLRYDGKPHLFFDHANNHKEHGFPCTDREWTLEDREQGAGSGERSIPSRRCMNCFFAHPPAPCCPMCNYEYPIQYREIDEVEGELVKLDPAAIEAKKKNDRMEVGRAKTLEDLWVIAKERGYKKGWVFTQAKLKGIKG